jgi:hypothetical protein
MRACMFGCSIIEVCVAVPLTMGVSICMRGIACHGKLMRGSFTLLLLGVCCLLACLANQMLSCFACPL